MALAGKNPEKRVIFLGVGFETTAPTIAGSILTAASRGSCQLFRAGRPQDHSHSDEILSADPELAIDGYLCPAHVSAIIGAEAYRFLAEEHGVPCVVTGFEPADIMQGVEMLVRQVVEGRSTVEIQYSRFVLRKGTRRPRHSSPGCFSVPTQSGAASASFPAAAWRLRPEYARFDAEKAMPVTVEEPREPEGCCCGEMLKGKIAPFDCPLFATACTPEHRSGPAWFRRKGAAPRHTSMDNRATCAAK